MAQQQVVKNEYRCFDVPMQQTVGGHTHSSKIEQLVREQADEQFYLVGLPEFRPNGTIMFMRQTPLPHDEVVRNAHIGLRLAIFQGAGKLRTFLDLEEDVQEAVITEILYPTQTVHS